MTPDPKERRRGSSAKITAQLEFSSTGYLRAVHLGAETDMGEEILERALDRLLKPSCISWVRRLFRRGERWESGTRRMD
jgi:hypothetical protein